MIAQTIPNLNPQETIMIPATPKTIPNMKSAGPQRVKSVFVVQEYIVIATTAAEVRNAAWYTTIGGAFAHIPAISQLFANVKAPKNP